MTTLLADSSFDYSAYTSGPALGSGLVGYLIGALLLGLVFKKAGEPMWKAFVPFLNMYTHFRIAGWSGWAFLLLIIPIVNVVVLILLSLRIGRAFGHGGVFSFFLLFLLSLIGYAVLAFDGSRYDRSAVA